MAKERKNKKRNNIDSQYSEKYGRTMWAYTVMIKGERMGRQYIYYTQKEAETALAKLRVRLRDEDDGLAPPDVPTVNLGDLRKRAEAEGASRRDLQTLDVYIETQEEKAATLLVSLRVADWNGFYKVYENLEPSSQNRYRTRVAGLLRKAVTWFKEIEEWEIWSPPKAERLDDGECGRDRKISKGEIARIFFICLLPQQPRETRGGAELRHEFYYYMRLRLLTATRPIEILRLTPQKIDWEEKTTIVITKKGKKIKKRPLYFTPTAMAILEPRMRRDVFFSFTKPQMKYLCRRITEIHNRIFTDYPPLVYGGRAEGGWVQNDFRRTSATILESYNSDLPYSAVMEVLGHARNDITSKYTGAELRRIIEAFKKLEAYVLEVDAIQKNLRPEGEQISHGKILVSDPVKEAVLDHSGHSI